ncbi:hypothetical protein M0R45_007966 [Rubus argutus]|uniref:Uncharacterized protein n=1 Tax=Rubus argutus TaxID=59490 RepID=A0AAW1Y063_RUBAR
MALLLSRHHMRMSLRQDVYSYFLFLTLAHIYDQIIESYCIYKGSSIGFWQGDIRFLLDDLQELKPTMFCGAPRDELNSTGQKQQLRGFELLKAVHLESNPL